MFPGVAIIAVASSVGCGTVQTAEPDASVTVDASIQSDSGANTDGAVIDASVGPETDAAVVSMPSLPDYLGCERDSDCPIGLGDCITEVPFNLADADGISMVAMQDVFPSLTTAGVCSLLCTDNALICDGLQLQLGDGPVASFSCQLITTGRAPYPAAPTAFPLVVDEAALAAGQAFAALCRPPFQLASDHSANLCDSCTEDSQCGSGDLCWASGIDAIGTDLVPGECLETCLSDTDCVVGFSCDELLDDAAAVLGNFCVPVERTCGECRDVDGDGRGVGLCSSDAASPTAYDCDDGNADAYFDPLDPAHPFPTFCGEQDFNCNGLSDQVEQLVSADHCGACNSPCEGAVGAGAASAQRECQAGGVCGFVCDDPLGQIDCDGDASNGCEIETLDVTKFVYWDDDSDGDGTPLTLQSPQSPLFLCEVGDRPAGYSLLNTDCDDIRGDVSGQFGIDNQCDAVDQDCDGPVDEGFAPVSCPSSGLGVCAPGTTSCSSGNESCISNVSPATETCSDIGIDNDCDGITSDVRNGGADVNIGAPCTATSATGECRNGTWICGSGGLACSPRAPSNDTFGNGLDEDCDGFDGDVSDTVYVSTLGNNSNNGSPGTPIKSIQLGINAAQSLSRSTVRVASGTYTRTQALTLLAGVRVVGGHNPSAGWQQGAGQTIVNISSDANDMPNILSFSGSVGLGCQEFVISSDGALNLKDMDIRVHRRTTGSNGEAVVGAWFRGCPYLTFEGVTITVDSGANGVNGGSGVVGASGGNGVNGNIGVRGDNQLGGASTSGGASTCAVRGGRGGRGGHATDITVNNFYGVGGSNGVGSGGTGTGGAGGPGGGEPSPEGIPGGLNGIGGANASSVGSGGSRGVFSATGPSLTTILSTGGSRRGSIGGSGSLGDGGGGGGGGSAGDRRGFGGDFWTSGSSGGSGGAGGCIGGGGEGGRGGGATIGVIVSISPLSLNGITIVVADGGAGGNGGSGGAGGSGSVGGTGGQALDDAGAGGNGGNGGNASGGGGGGGAAGGHCVGVIRVGGVSTGTPSVTLGSNGAGGAAGSGGGIGALQGDSGAAGTGASGGIAVISL